MSVVQEAKRSAAIAAVMDVATGMLAVQEPALAARVAPQVKPVAVHVAQPTKVARVIPIQVATKNVAQVPKRIVVELALTPKQVRQTAASVEMPAPVDEPVAMGIACVLQVKSSMQVRVV
jgi:hypothetical protein